MHDLIPLDAIPPGALVAYEAETDAMRTFAQNEKAEATRRAYTSDMRAFSTWCRELRGREVIVAPPLLSVLEDLLGVRRHQGRHLVE